MALQMHFAHLFMTLSIAYMNWMISSPPNPPAPSEERPVTKCSEAMFDNIAGRVVSTAQAIVTLTAFCEGAGIGLLLLQSSTSTPSYINAACVNGIRAASSSTMAWIVGMLGCTIRYKAISALNHMFTYQLALRKDHQLITSGLYSFVRHPAYTGSIVAAVGTAAYFLMPGSYIAECHVLQNTVGQSLFAIWASWKIYMTVHLIVRTQGEDEMLRGRFGDEWIQYARKTPNKLIPGIY
ncbi:hypothetical protein BDQ17DRAFT_1312459 [Cyathus striatus]|nr:hypothetical protein BDQ17DRAFT_1312459 [Cyathus striatus]